MIFRPRSIIGTITGSRQDLRDVVALAQAGKLAPVPVTRMPKDAANAALELLKSGNVVGRIVLEQAGLRPNTSSQLAAARA
jgi:alcohol dehydrogenase/propanol-preferring alcohol dehydrogenase